MPGKYEHLRGKIPAFVEEPAYQEKVDEKKRELLGTLDGSQANSIKLATMFVEYERKRDALYERYDSETNDAEYEINLYRKALSQFIVEAFEDQGVPEIRLAGNELVKLDDKPILSVKNEETTFKWAMKNCPEILSLEFNGLNANQIEKLADWAGKHKLTIKMTIGKKKLNDLARENALQGRRVPPGMSLFLLTQAKVFGLHRNGDKGEEE